MVHQTRLYNVFSKMTVSSDSPKHLGNHEKKRFSKNRWEGCQPVDSGCARPTHSDRRECSCLSVGGSAKASVLSSALKLDESNKKNAQEKPKMRTRNAAKPSNELTLWDRGSILLADISEYLANNNALF